MTIEKFSYNIIDRTGKIILQGAKSIDSIGDAGIAKVEGANYTCSLFRTDDMSLHPLPDTIEGKKTIYVANPNCPASHTIVGYCLEEKRDSQTKSLLDFSLLPENMCAVSSFTLDSEMNVLSKPVPYNLAGFRDFGTTTLADDVHEHFYLMNRMGDVLHQFPADWERRLSILDENSNVCGLIYSKKSGNRTEQVQAGNCWRDIKYHLDIERHVISGPYTDIEEFGEGIRYVRGIDGVMHCVDKDFNTLFTSPHLKKYPYFAILSPCCHGHVAFTTGLKAGLLNKSGDIVVKPRYSYIAHIHGPFWWYYKGRKYGIMHESGELITDAIYFASPFGEHEYGSGIVPAGTMIGRKRKWGYIDLSGQWIISPQFDLCYSFVNRDYAITRNCD